MTSHYEAERALKGAPRPESGPERTLREDPAGSRGRGNRGGIAKKPAYRQNRATAGTEPREGKKETATGCRDSTAAPRGQDPEEGTQLRRSGELVKDAQEVPQDRTSLPGRCRGSERRRNTRRKCKCSQKGGNVPKWPELSGDEQPRGENRKEQIAHRDAGSAAECRSVGSLLSWKLQEMTPHRVQSIGNAPDSAGRGRSMDKAGGRWTNTRQTIEHAQNG